MPKPTNESNFSRFPLRLRAVAILRFGSVDALYKRLPICPRAVAYQVGRGALSDQMQEALTRQIGPDAYRFIVGKTDVLRDSPLSAEAQP